MLIFGDDAHVGLHLGPESATGGGAINLGYKHRSIALVPVSVLNDDGIADAIRADDTEAKDALPVFAVFETSSPSGDAKDTQSPRQLHVGQIFSTGAAAQAITTGYRCRAEGATTCPAPTTASTPSTTTSTPSKPAISEPRQKGPFQTPLVYARTDIFGLDAGVSLQDVSTSQEAGLTLSYGSRNLALVPVYRESANHHIDALYSESINQASRRQGRDAFSVLGQFQSSNGLTTTAFGLSRFFATGMAAANLARGLQATVSKGQAELPPNPAPAASAASEAN
jgi:hypothetical protein